MSDKPPRERRGFERRGGQRRDEGRIASARRPTDQRQHTRYDRDLMVRMYRRGHRANDQVTFSATVGSADISAGGIFLRSTFFLRKGLELDLEIDLEELDRTIHVSGEVARVIDDERRGDTGFGIRFTEFREDGEIYLRAFLAKGDVFAFVDGHADELLPGLSNRQRGRLVELIVRWEIYQESLDKK